MLYSTCLPCYFFARAEGQEKGRKNPWGEGGLFPAFGMLSESLLLPLKAAHLFPAMHDDIVVLDQAAAEQGACTCTLGPVRYSVSLMRRVPLVNIHIAGNVTYHCWAQFSSRCANGAEMLQTNGKSLNSLGASVRREL